jgi:hypothetical protein
MALSPGKTRERDRDRGILRTQKRNARRLYIVRRRLGIDAVECQMPIVTWQVAPVSRRGRNF